MYKAIVGNRSGESTRLFLASVIALALTLLTAACGGDKESTLVNEVTAAEVPPVSVATAPGSITPTTPMVSPTVTYAEGEAAYNAKRYSEATEIFAVISLRTPENAWGHYMHGLSAWKSGNRERAESAFMKALERDSNHVKTRINLARVLLEGGRASEALPHVEVALTVDSLSADGYRVLGRVQSELKEVGPAIDAYLRAIVLNEKDAWSMNNMGFVLIQGGRFEEALGPLSRAVELNPGLAVFHNNLGMALERTFRFTQAAESYRAALAADSTYRKASASLERIKDRKDDSGISPVDLKALAASFAESVKG